MFGIHPTPRGATLAAAESYGASGAGLFLAGLGIASLLLLALMPATFGGGPLAALIALPLALGGLAGVLIGYVALATRIEITADGLVVAVPGWRVCPCPPVREVRLGWRDVRAIRRRTEIYRIGPLPLRLRFEVFALETTHGRLLFGSYYLWELEPVLIHVGHRADCAWREDDPVEAGLWHTLRCGPPDWPALLELH